MVLDDDDIDIWQKLRRKRIRNLREYLKKVKEIDKKLLLGKLGIDGLHRITALSHLRDLKDTGEIDEKNGKIIWIGHNDNEDSKCKSSRKEEDEVDE